MPSRYVIGEHFEAFIKAQIQRGRYVSASDVIRDGLQVLEEQETLYAATSEALRVEIERGAASGPGIPSDQVFARARALIAQRATRNDSPG